MLSTLALITITIFLSSTVELQEGIRFLTKEVSNFEPWSLTVTTPERPELPVFAIKIISIGKRVPVLVLGANSD